MRHRIGEIWKEEPRWDKQGKWKVQFPYGIATFKTRRDAAIMSIGFFGMARAAEISKGVVYNGN